MQLAPYNTWRCRLGTNRRVLESWECERCCIMYIMSEIDMTDVIAIAMDIWSGRHANIL